MSNRVGSNVSRNRVGPCRATEDISSVATEDTSSVATEDISSVATEDMSSAAAEEMPSVDAVPHRVGEVTVSNHVGSVLR